MKKITRNRFNALVAFTRNPAILQITEELGWYESSLGSLFGVVSLDKTDNDYSAVVLGRDENRSIRCVDVQVSFSQYENAEEWLINAADKLENTSDDIYPQGEVRKTIDLFKPTVEESKLDPFYRILSSQPSYSAARNLIKEITPHFFDVDGNFAQQFQTSGFDSRLWELYLFCYFNEESLRIDRSNAAPDYLLANGVEEVGVEAVIVGRRKEESVELHDYTKLEIGDILKDRMPIKFGSPLYTKLKHTNSKGEHYWEYPHTVGKPFVIAVADFHQDYSMSWSQLALINYLYGYKYYHHYNDDNELVVIPQRIDEHKDGDKVIPSGFFNQEGSENISAILSTSVGTISKFSRIGKQSGFDEHDITMIRTVAYHDHNPNASKPIIKRYTINEKCSETWSEGMTVYHNPNAKFPLSFNFFGEAAQYYFEDEYVKSLIPEKHPYSSFTMLIQPK